MFEGRNAVAVELLTIVATLLPLTAILLQFTVRFYEPSDGNGISTRGAAAVYFAVFAVSSLAVSGYVAADVVRVTLESSRVTSATEFIQVGLVLLLLAVLLVAYDVLREFGSSPISVLKILGNAEPKSAGGGGESTGARDKANGDEEANEESNELEENP